MFPEQKYHLLPEHDYTWLDHIRTGFTLSSRYNIIALLVRCNVAYLSLGGPKVTDGKVA